MYAGPGLGGGNDESLLDKIPDVNPLNALELLGLVGHSSCVVVPDSDITINYDAYGTTDGNLQGNTLGVVALTVLEIENYIGASRYPYVKIRIEDTANCGADGFGVGGSISSDNGKILLVR